MGRTVYTEMNGYYQDITGILLDLLGFTSTFADIPGSIACKLITLVLYSSMLLFKHDYRFFFEVPSFEELQDPNSSPRREEVGRRTLRDHGGFLLSFFCRARFQLLTSKCS